MNIDKKCFTPATDMQIWPPTYVKVSPPRTLRRHRAAAREKWPI